MEHWTEEWSSSHMLDWLLCADVCYFEWVQVYINTSQKYNRMVSTFLKLLIAKCSVCMLAMLHETSGLTVSCTQNATSRWHCIDPLCVYHMCIYIFARIKYFQIPLLYAGLYAQKYNWTQLHPLDFWCIFENARYIFFFENNSFCLVNR